MITCANFLQDVEWWMRDKMQQLNYTTVRKSGELFFSLFGCYRSRPNLSIVLRQLDTPFTPKMFLHRQC